MTTKLSLILLFCLGLVLQSKADETDISSYQNILYLSHDTVQAGTQQYNLSLKMRNTEEVSGFQVFIVLPHGMTFSADEDGTSLAETNDDRLAPGKFSLNTRIIGTDTLGIVLFTATLNPKTDNLYTISGSDGEVVSVPVDVPADFKPGDYTIKFYKQELAGPNAETPGKYAEVLFPITVTAPENRTVLDETSTAAPVASAGAVDVRVNRTVNANEWSTICLPFDMTEAQLKTAFGDDVRLAKFKDWSSEFVNEDDEYASSITINFASVTSLSANTPYIIKTSKDIKTFTVDGVTIAPATVEQTYGSKKRANYAAFHGTYEANRTLDDGVLFLSGGKFWYSVGKTVTKAFRCYLDLLFTLDYKNSVSSAKVNYRVDNTATNIHGINIATVNNDKVYSLSGRLMGEAGKITSLPKGVYIKNGKKIVVKD